MTSSKSYAGYSIRNERQIENMGLCDLYFWNERVGWCIYFKRSDTIEYFQDKLGPGIEVDKQAAIALYRDILVDLILLDNV